MYGRIGNFYSFLTSILGGRNKLYRGYEYKRLFPLNRRQLKTWHRSGYFGEDKNLLSFPEIEHRIIQAVSLVTTVYTLSQLHSCSVTFCKLMQLRSPALRYLCAPGHLFQIRKPFGSAELLHNSEDRQYCFRNIFIWIYSTFMLTFRNLASHI